MRLPVECITAPASSLRRAVLSLLPGALSRLALSEAEGSKRALRRKNYSASFDIIPSATRDRLRMPRSQARFHRLRAPGLGV